MKWHILFLVVQVFLILITFSLVLSHMTRMLPQRAWAASIPTLLSHDALDTLLTPNRPPSLPYTVSLSPLERFLGSVFLRRNLPRLIQSESVSLQVQQVKIIKYLHIYLLNMFNTYLPVSTWRSFHHEFGLKFLFYYFDFMESLCTWYVFWSHWFKTVIEILKTLDLIYIISL